jgi:hypothetical protein
MMNTDEEYAAFMSTSARHIAVGNISFVKLPSLEYDFSANKPTDGVSVVLDGGAERLWRIDRSICTHLGGDVLSGFNAAPRVDPKVAMLWNPRRPVVHNPVSGEVFGGTSFISMLDNRILTIEGRMLTEGRKSSSSYKIFETFRKGIYTLFRGAYTILDNDPRHIGTHRDSTVSALHFHIVKPGFAEWTEEDMERLAELAEMTQAVVAEGTGAAASLHEALEKELADPTNQPRGKSRVFGKGK